MPINSTHQKYQEVAPKVKRTRDCFKGTDAVKEAGVEYLPQLDGQTDTAYGAMKKRGLFLPVVEPTSVAFVGAIMRKEPTHDIPSSIDFFVDDTDGNKRDLTLLASIIVGELLISGRSGVLVEHNGDRPIFLLYSQESIINWTDEYVVLMQTYEVKDQKDKFKTVEAIEYIELTFDEDGFYIQNIWRQTNKKWGIYKTEIPTKRGERLAFIPFSVCNTMELGWNVTDPAMLSIADINLDHYRLSTDLRHGLHYTALPTMFVFGDLRSPDGTEAELTVGAGSANHIPDIGGRAELLEFTGAGLGAIDNAITKDVEAMASIGAKMFQSQSTGAVKAAETARIEASGESATLSTIANSAEAQIEQALGWAAEWEGASDDVEFKLNRDFLDTKLDPAELTALLAALHGGGISLDTFLNNLMKGEILTKGTTIEEEKEKIAGDNSNNLDLGDE